MKDKELNCTTWKNLDREKKGRGMLEVFQKQIKIT